MVLCIRIVFFPDNFIDNRQARDWWSGRVSGIPRLLQTHWSLCILGLCMDIQCILLPTQYVDMTFVKSVYMPHPHPSLPRKLKSGYTGFTLSVHASVCPSVDQILSALHLPQYYPIHFIFIFTHLINQLKKVVMCHVFVNTPRFEFFLILLNSLLNTSCYGLLWM